MASVIKGTIWEDTAPFFMARVVGNDGANLTQSDVTTVYCIVVDLADTATQVHAEFLTVASVIFDTLQTDARWTIDSTGYNFGFAIADTTFVTGDRTYRVSCLFDLASGGDADVEFEITTRKTYRPTS